VVAQSQDLQQAIGWFKGQFTNPINAAVKETPFHVDFFTAVAIQESYEIWGRAYKIKSVSELLELCVGDILDASGGRNPRAFPQSRAVLERAPRGKEMFKIAGHALESMAEVAIEYKKYLKNKNKFCHAFGIFQYDIQAFTHDADYFIYRDWCEFPKCLDKCLMELHRAWGATFPKKKKLSDKELIYVAIAYNQGHADPKKTFKQVYKAKGDEKYYGEHIWDYLKLSKATPAAA
jgi:hypothetical protein